MRVGCTASSARALSSSSVDARSIPSSIQPGYCPSMKRQSILLESHWPLMQEYRGGRVEEEVASRLMVGVQLLGLVACTVVITDVHSLVLLMQRHFPSSHHTISERLISSANSCLNVCAVFRVRLKIHSPAQSGQQWSFLIVDQ